MPGPASTPDPAAPTLAYEQPAPDAPARGMFHRWFAPVVWLPGAAGVWAYHGGEWVAFQIGLMPAIAVVDVAWRLASLGKDATFIAVVYAVGGAILFALGFVADVLRVDRQLWIWTLPALTFVSLINGIAFAAALSEPDWQGNATAFFFVGWTWGVQLTLLVAMVVTLVVARRRQTRGVVLPA